MLEEGSGVKMEGSEKGFFLGCVRPKLIQKSGGNRDDAGLLQSNDLSSQRGEYRFVVQPYQRLPNSRSKQNQYPSTDR